MRSSQILLLELDFGSGGMVSACVCVYVVFLLVVDVVVVGVTRVARAGSLNTSIGLSKYSH